MYLGNNQDGQHLPFSGTIASGVDEVVTFTASDTLTEGTFKLTLGGVETAGSCDFDATAAEFQALLESHAGIGAGNVTCTGGPISANATPIVATFGRKKAGLDIGAITVTSATSIVGGTIGVVETTKGVKGTYRGYPGNNPIVLKTDTGIAYYRTGTPNTPTWTEMEFYAVSDIN